MDPMIMTDGGMCHSGMIANTIPGTINFNTSTHQYEIDQPSEYINPAPLGYKISANLPRKIVPSKLLAEFDLYTKDQQGNYEPTTAKLRFYYEIHNVHSDETSNTMQMDVIFKADWFNFPNGSDPFAVDSHEIIRTSFHATLYTGAQSNVLAFDDTYEGFCLHHGEVDEHPFLGIYMNATQWVYLTDNRWVKNASASGGRGIGFYLDEEVYDGYYMDPKEKTDPNEESGYPDDGPAGPGGGNGTHDRTDDNYGVPGLPGLSATAAGFVTLYNPSLAQINAIADELILDNIWDKIKNFITNLEDFVVGLGIIPVQPSTGGNVYPRLDHSTHLSTALPLIINQYVELNCGTVLMDRYYDSAFDCSGNTSVQIFLPYIGYRDLNVDDILGKNIGVVYHIDVYSGNLLCYVTADGQVYYQYSGNCLQQVPTAKISYNNMLDCGITLAAAAIAPIAAGAVAGELAGGLAAGEAASEAMAGGAAATASSNSVIGSTMMSVMGQKPQITRSGTMGGSSGLLGGQIPYIIKTIPRQSLPGNYRTVSGYPSNISGTLGSFSGFTVIDSCNLSGIPATDEEKAEIMSYLKGGVIV